MCGWFTRNYTWEQIHTLYGLTAPVAIPNLQPRFNACPTDPADTIVEHEGKRELVEMRWGLVPFWWSQPLKELRLAAFNARVETMTTKPFFREPFKSKRCLMPVSGYYTRRRASSPGISRCVTELRCLRSRASGMNGRTAKRVSA
jgi:putative SOS response-associated peptidase YedK